ncbi:MAG TPA: PorP/SprF family type IX secretion system membrane protein [Chitinophagaceae bacterium]|nr:PorP/SprF family type IX secretion system membrane protein [Chitinophagaceae bacterium]
MKRYIILFAFIGGISMTARSQQLQTSSLYDMQGMLHNPSTAGANGYGMVGLTYRSQWSHLSGSPKTATAFGSFDMPAQKIGLGGYIYNDQTGATSRTGIDLAFAKYIPMKDGARLSFGIDARAQQFSIDRAKLSQTLGSDPAIGSSDNKFKFDAGFGISYTSKKLQVGVSASQLIQSKLDFYNGSLTPAEEGRLYRHYYFHGLYHLKLDESTVITPNFLMIYLPNAPTEFQGGVRVEHNELFWWGVSYRARQSFMLSAGVTISKKFVIGYSFDIYKTPLSVYDAGSNAHEVLLRYNFIK